MINCYVIDDEPHAVDLLSKRIASTPGLELVGHTTNPLLGLQYITNNTPPDLTFVDIDMAELSGLDLATLINPLTKVVFITAFNQYAVEAFEKEALDYLLKPISNERFLKCINKYKKTVKVELPPPAEQTIFVQGGSKGEMVRLYLDDITYIEAIHNRANIYLTDNSSITTSLSITDAEDSLPKAKFSRVHRSAIVNHDQIKSYNSNQITLSNKTVINIGDTFKDTFLQKINKMVVKSKA